MPVHGPHRAGLICVVLGWHGGLRLQPNTAQCRARTGLGPKLSCWARVHVEPNCRALGQPIGLVPNYICNHQHAPTHRALHEYELVHGPATLQVD
jgi:hypothetical protein